MGWVWVFLNSHTSVLRAGCLAIAVSDTLETAPPTPPLFTWDAAGVEVLDIVIWLPIEVTPSWTWLEMGDSVCMPPLLLWPSGSMSLLLVWSWFSVLRCSSAAAPSPLLPARVEVMVMFRSTRQKCTLKILIVTISALVANDVQWNPT